MGCGRNFKESYDYKEHEGLLDKRVSIEKRDSDNITIVKVTFEEKEIPLIFDVANSKYPYRLDISVKGFLRNGKVTIKVWSKINGGNEEFTQTIDSGIIDVAESLDFYDKDYKIMFEFENAKDGDITFTFSLHTL